MRTWRNAWRITLWFVESNSVQKLDELNLWQGSAFIAYGTIMAVLLVVGEAWVQRSGRSPEFWDSWIITLWGIGKY